MNVATYGPGGRFAMTDRGRKALRQSRESLTIGPSSMYWLGNRLVIEIDEWSGLPKVSRLRGRITVTPAALTSVELPLSPDGAHVWRPFAPTCAIRVELDRPGWEWDGHGYFDANFGTRALEQDFARWTWGRFPTGEGCTCFYDAELRDGGTLQTAFHFGADGSAQQARTPDAAKLPRSLWGVARETRSDAGYQPRQILAMLDAPFYCRSAVRTRIHGEETTGVHEALDLMRFRSPFLKPMLALRVPRRTHWRFDQGRSPTA